MKLPNAESIEERGADRALSAALREIGRLARAVEEQSARIESLEGANVKRDSETEPDRMAEPTDRTQAVKDCEGNEWTRLGSDRWSCSKSGLTWGSLAYRYGPLTLCDPEPEPAPAPYRMAEPKNVGAVVMGAWFDALFTRFDRELNPWVSLRTGCVYEWVDIPDPQPYQNCTLTADDPEPPVDSSVRSPEGVVSVRWPSGWSDIGLPRGQRFGWDEVTEATVTLLYRGEA